MVDSNTTTRGKIPIRNIWWLLWHASEDLDGMLRVSGRFGLEKADDVADLVAQILIHAVEHRIRSGLSTGMVRRRADLTRVRGSIDHIRTESRLLLQRGQVACSFDDLVADTPENRVVMAALDKMSKVASNEGMRRRCNAASITLGRAGVTKEDPRVMQVTARRIVIGWSSPEDRPMLGAARLVLDPMLPTEDYGGSYLPKIDRGQKQLWNLFEKAIWGFYHRKQSEHGWTVCRQVKKEWQKENSTGRIEDLLGGMNVDIEMTRYRNGTLHRSIIDTKFKDIVAPSPHGPRFVSQDVYQMYAYLRSQERQDDPSTLCSSGMLLYGSIGEDFDESTTIQGHRFRFATVDLTKDGQAIEGRLLYLLNS